MRIDKCLDVKYVLVLSFLTLIHSCKNNMENENETNDNLLKQEFYEDGSLKATYFLSNDGLMNGTFKDFYPSNNKLKSEGLVRNGFRVGKWKFFHVNGVLRAKGEYADGFKDGEWTYYSNDSQILSRVQWDVYRNEEYLFEMSIPKSWFRDTSTNEVIISAYESNNSDSFNPNFNVTTFNTSRGFSLLQTMQNTSEATGINYLKTIPLEINGKNALCGVINVVNSSEEEVHGLHFYIEANERVMLMSFYCLREDFGKYETLFKEIALSYQSFEMGDEKIIAQV